MTGETPKNYRHLNEYYLIPLHLITSLNTRQSYLVNILYQPYTVRWYGTLETLESSSGSQEWISDCFHSANFATVGMK